ncbi:zinc-dependent alcohol dehydrogenase [Edaphobacter albus]|uniref:zinc-dependent alcohol dehydrogenase n=1 Tax=Edaphobacter sp. 4G125 TaxID=2763071 RepID=UPI0016443C08|nr:galactitol-1-phosphate 5-dehydrogenase [Edaphobacter sp. 4G125]QNI38332.1 galactitol-1-phosphate 5-dehydrogenase [Edaphobacter sp. 4G125]
MRALLLSEYRHLELADVPLPQPAADEVLLRIEACGICGSDVHGYDGSSGRRIPPIIMGHEAAGVIAKVGSGVKGWKEGDRVTFDSTLYCGKCQYCQRGEVNLCDNRQVFGVSCKDYRRHGAFAEYLVVPARVLYFLPAELSFVEAAMVEAVSVALHAVQVSGFQPGETALVLGAGMIGSLIVQSLRVADAAHIFVVDPDESRVQAAARSGAHTPIHLLQEGNGSDVTQAVLERYPGGVDHVFEAVGFGITVKTAIDVVRKGGTVTLVGNIEPEVKLPLQDVVTRQIRLQGSAASAGEYPRAIELLASKKIDVSPFISAVEPLSRGASAFDRLYRREPNVIKIVLTPDVA